jgi:hypothetical protein
MLYRAAATGTLELIEDRGVTAGRTHRIALRRGLVSDVETPLSVARLGDILQKEGFVTRDTLRSCARDVEGSERTTLGQSLLEAGAVSREALSAALRHQLRTRLDRLFALKEAKVRFRVPRPRPEQAAEVPLSPHEFLAGRPRARTHRRRSTQELAARRLDPSRIRAFGTLGLGPDAGPLEIHRAFRTLAAENHPDRHPGASEQERQQLMQRFAALSAAYHVLLR